MSSVSRLKEELLCLHQRGVVNLDRNMAGTCEQGEFYYAHIALPLIDAVFSTGQDYLITMKVVSNYCSYYGLTINVEGDAYPEREDQEPLSRFIRKFIYEGESFFRKEIFRSSEPVCFKNIGRTKAMAVLDFAELLRDRDVEYLQDIASIQCCSDFRSSALSLPGISENVLDYFMALSCTCSTVRPSPKVIHFINQLSGSASGHSSEEVHLILQELCSEFKESFPSINLKILNYIIWDYMQRARYSMLN